MRAEPGRLPFARLTAWRLEILGTWRPRERSGACPDRPVWSPPGELIRSTGRLRKGLQSMGMSAGSTNFAFSLRGRDLSSRILSGPTRPFLPGAHIYARFAPSCPRSARRGDRGRGKALRPNPAWKNRGARCRGAPNTTGRLSFLPRASPPMTRASKRSTACSSSTIAPFFRRSARIASFVRHLDPSAGKPPSSRSARGGMLSASRKPR